MCHALIFLTRFSFPQTARTVTISYLIAHKYTGASINLPVFAKSLPFAFIMCVVRAACIFTGSATPGYFLKQSKAMNLTIWLTLLPQGKCAVEVLSSFSRDGIP